MHPVLDSVLGFLIFAIKDWRGEGMGRILSELKGLAIMEMSALV